MKKYTHTLVVSAACAVAGLPAEAATLIQPDVTAGVTWLDYAGFTDEQDVSTAGAELDAKLKIGFVGQRDTVMLMPMIRFTKYEDDQISEREEQRLRFEWFREFLTAASRTNIDLSRRDLFTTELEDDLLDPDEVPDFDDPEDSEVVDVETTRNKLQFRQDFAKALGLRDDLAFGAEFVDISYDDEGGLRQRVDFNEWQLDGAWIRSLSERTNVLLAVGAERYDGDNNITADSLSGELGFDVQVSETTELSIMAGYERTETEDQLQDLGTTNEFIFNLGGQKNTELTQFRANVFRNVRPTSVGGLTVATGATFHVSRKLTELVTFSAGISGFRQDRPQSASAGDDRDYLTGRLQLSWQLTQQWWLEAIISHTREEFESPPIVGGSTTEDRSRAFLNLRYRGLAEVSTPSDRRFLRKGY